MAVNAKWVRITAPAGVSCNYMAVTGNLNATVVSFDIIKRLIDRGALVEELKTDGTFITLDEKNYNTDNSGKVVDETAQYAADIEKEHNDASKAKYDARIEEIKKEIFGK